MDAYALTFDAFDKMAQAYQDRYMELDLYNDTYAAFCALLPQPHARILELGCGPGNITRYLLARRPDYRITATDVAPAMVQLARQNNPTATCQLLDCRALGQLSEQYEGIVCGFCLPYLSRADCARLIHDCAARLTDAGVLYLSAIEGDYQQSGFESSSNGQHKAYVYYHQEAYLREQLARNGFAVAGLVRKHFGRPDGTPSVHLIIIAQLAGASSK
ncbi:class I SAM-dependent methyltransferase [Hymenobacter latericus]|uniref:class I SAM-dependent methyltransferase n=1 Tax=Hymenobacter sp. YIM 151858-1 TaxID=2987688 RepID=UPI0022266544|nr:class I SAM-dependent methyltransferase [Hymenobacter sp. YIM 151858-1]UYZ57394.1 class I SAM-dependent methyltransferase [Hymenobacter sp. YIM 151858-1]